MSALTTGRAFVVVRQGGTTYISNANVTGSSEFAVGVPTIAIMEFASKTEVNLHINGDSFNVPLGVGVELPDPSVNRFGILAELDSTPSAFSSAKVIWACQFGRALTTAEKTALMNDNPYAVTWASATDSFYAFDGNMRDLVGTRDMTNSGVLLTERCDNSTYHCDERGFAVKTGVIYPKLLDGTGYAGLVGDPDAVYQGLIATKGGYDAEAQNYLKTKFSFTATDNTEIENAGLILDDYTALDCNDDLIYTADPYLDTLTYPNAFTAMTLSNVSQQRYNNLADNNASRRIFIKYKKGTDVTDDGSRALITAGTVQEILVYKRDLTVAEAVKVLKYCNDFPMDNQVMVGNVPSVDGDDNFVFSCTGHTEPEIEIEEP